MTSAPNSFYVFTDQLGAIVDFEPPTATDNSGTVNLIRQTRSPNSYFSLGTTAVSYVFADPSNNAVTVTFFVTVLSSEYLPHKVKTQYLHF